jgi:preprotein translocase subunit SecB
MGFPPLMLDPIDFASAYMAQIEAQQQQQQGVNGNDQPNPTEV